MTQKFSRDFSAAKEKEILQRSRIKKKNYVIK